MSTRFSRTTGLSYPSYKKIMPIADENFICYRHYSILRIGFMLGVSGQRGYFNFHPPVLGAAGGVGVGSDGFGFPKSLD